MVALLVRPALLSASELMISESSKIWKTPSFGELDFWGLSSPNFRANMSGIG